MVRMEQEEIEDKTEATMMKMKKMHLLQGAKK
jgi:hypothetical protein